MDEKTFCVYQLSPDHPPRAVQTTLSSCESQIIEAIKQQESIASYEAGYRFVSGVESPEEAVQKALENGFKYVPPRDYVSASVIKPRHHLHDPEL